MNASKIKVRIFFLFFVLLTICNIKTNGQEEFYGNHNGLSFSYLQALNENANAVGVSTYFKKGFILGVAGEEANNQFFPALSLLFCPNWDEDSTQLKVGFGPSYSSIQYHHTFSFNIGLIKRFFSEKNFPFSIYVSASPHIFLSKKSDAYKHSWKYQHTETVIGCGYTQAFFAKSYIYPVIGISYTYATDSKIDLFTAIAGINIKLD